MRRRALFSFAAVLACLPVRYAKATPIGGMQRVRVRVTPIPGTLLTVNLGPIPHDAATGSSNYLDLYYNGVLQAANSYTLRCLNGQCVITTAIVPAAGDQVEVAYWF